MKKYWQVIHLWSVILLLAAVCGCAATSKFSRIANAPDGEVVEAEGMSPIVAEDLLGAKKASLADAQRIAIEKVVGVLVSGKTLVDKAVTIEQNILAKSTGYVKKYEVLKERREGVYYYTSIEALVYRQRIWADLDKLALLRSPVIGNPRVAVFIPDQDLSNVLAQGLTKHGFKVVHRRDSDIIITGDSSTEILKLSQLDRVISIRGTLSARAERTRTGEVLSAVSIQASGVDATEWAAHKKTMTILGEKAANDLSESLASLLAVRHSITLTATGITSFKKLFKLRDALTDIEGIDDLYVRSYSEGTAEIEIDLATATPMDIAKALVARGWKIVEQTQDTLRIK